MTQIDNMTTQKIDVLKLKGMLSDCHRAPLVERTSGAGDTWQQCQSCNKPAAPAAQAAQAAQAQHSPLPWKVWNDKITIIRAEDEKPWCRCAQGIGFNLPEAEANAALIVRACNNAQRLADALTRALTGLDASGQSLLAADVREALAEWSKAQ